MTIDKDKQIYRTPDGAFTYDPLALRRKLLIGSQNKLNEWVGTYNDAIEELDRLSAEESLVTVARSAFGVEPVEKGGICDATVLEYLAHYLEWLSAPLSAATETSPIDRPCTDCLKKK